MFIVQEKKGYAIDSPTLVYMPHCDMELHEDILKDNSTVRNAILICNRLGDYVERYVEWRLRGLHMSHKELRLQQQSFPQARSKGSISMPNW